MLVFIVPIKSAQISSNWEVFSILVERTMRSICNQSSSNFKVVAACHEIPQLNFEHPSLEFVQVDFDPPTDEAISKLNQGQDPKNYRNAAKEADKAKKIMAGISHARKYDPSHFMVVDADDCISKDLASFVDQNKSDQSAGWYIKSGYIYNEGSQLIFLNKNTFNVLCGTCLIIRPEHVQAFLDTTPHPLFKHEMTELKNGKALHPLPFPGAIYSIGNTENYCSTPEAIKKMNSYRFLHREFFENLIRKLSKYRVRLVTTNLRNEFGLTKLNFERILEKTDA